MSDDRGQKTLLTSDLRHLTALPALEHLLGDQRRGHCRRPAGVEGEMGDDLAQLALFETVVEGALQMADQLFLAAERDQGGAGDQAAVALREARALPYLPEQHPLAEFDEGRDGVAHLVTRCCRLLCCHGLPFLWLNFVWRLVFRKPSSSAGQSRA